MGRICMESFLEKLCFVGSGREDDIGLNGLAAFSRGALPSMWERIWWPSPGASRAREYSEWICQDVEEWNPECSSTERGSSSPCLRHHALGDKSRSLVFIRWDYRNHFGFCWARSRALRPRWYSVSPVQCLAQPDGLWCAWKRWWLFPSTLNFSEIYWIWSLCLFYGHLGQS